MMKQNLPNPDPHQNSRIEALGPTLDQADAAMIMIHGRGADAQDILGLVAEINLPGFAFLAPTAANNSWYPNRFTAPLESNEPGISSGLKLIGTMIDSISAAGIDHRRIFLLGFSQGACLSLEFAARNPRRFAGVAALSGGLIGPDISERNYTGDLAGTPVFLGCSDVDLHIPAERVRESASLLARMGGDVTERLYSGMGHTINREEIVVVREMMSTVNKKV